MAVGREAGGSACQVGFVLKGMARDLCCQPTSQCTSCPQNKITSCFDRILELEQSQWTPTGAPEVLQGLYHTQLSIDVHMVRPAGAGRGSCLAPWLRSLSPRCHR